MNLVEIQGDLFSTLQEDKEYCYVQCISADLKMGKGIALDFNKNFNSRNELNSRRTKVKWSDAGFCLKQRDNVYHLITKGRYWEKPTYRTIRESLIDFKQAVLMYQIKDVAMPKIGCGLDNLHWDKVKTIIENLFGDTNVNFYVYYLE